MRGLPRLYWFLWLGALVNRLGGFIYTFLAFYLTEQRHLSVARAGAIVSLYGLGSLLSSPVGGLLADRLGRRQTMLFGFTMSAAAMLHLGFARAPWHIALGALLVGFFADLFRPAQHAIIADVVPPSQRTRAYGYLYWAVNLGFAGASIIAGLLASKSFVLLFIGDAATTLFFGIMIYLGVPETRPARDQEHETISLATPLGDPDFIVYVLLVFVLSTINQQLSTTLAVDMRGHGVAPERYGYLLAINGVMIIVLQPSVVTLVQRYRRARVLALGTFLTGVAYGLCYWADTVPAYAVVVVCFTFGELAYAPLTSTVTADLAPTHLRGSYQGVYLAAGGAATLLAPLVGGVVMQQLGARVLWAGCFVAGSLAAWLHLVIAPARRRRLALCQVEGGVAREDGVAA